MTGCFVYIFNRINHNVICVTFPPGEIHKIIECTKYDETIFAFESDVEQFIDKNIKLKHSSSCMNQTKSLVFCIT